MIEYSADMQTVTMSREEYDAIKRDIAYLFDLKRVLLTMKPLAFEQVPLSGDEYRALQMDYVHFFAMHPLMEDVR